MLARNPTYGNQAKKLHKNRTLNERFATTKIQRVFALLRF
jgi:hypothetical protein